MGHCDTIGVPSEKGAVRWVKPCQCYKILLVLNIHIRKETAVLTLTYHGEILIFDIVEYSDLSGIAFLQVKRWTRTCAVEKDRISLLTVDCKISCCGD
jgi:hypothetical protein